ncbi:hypothetical protein JW968_07555 [Candidatus Woesearchaeota archaeon]|nr:hypothetical protein [Candidatus Woesearchaeota archaeon]
MEKRNEWIDWLNTIAIVGILIWLAVLTFTRPALPDQGEWKCGNLVCEDGITAEQWINENCFQQEQQVVCGVMMNGQNTLVPLEQIDTAKLGQCFVARCLQDINVRTVNYTIDLRNLTQ